MYDTIHKNYDFCSLEHIVKNISFTKTYYYMVGMMVNALYVSHAMKYSPYNA